MLETNEAFSRYLIPDIARADYVYEAVEEMVKSSESEKIIDLEQRKKGG